MKKWLIGILVFLFVAAAAVFLFREQITQMMFAAALKPSADFADMPVPEAPKYSENAAWAALPETDDGADFEGPGLTDGQADADAAVFFVHPTTYISKDGWNAPLDAAEAKAQIDDLVLRAQASVFNKCCAVYAPYYRQATFYSFFEESPSSEAALDLAYRDVEDAFESFLNRIGDKPFILAGHSQGAKHIMRLMEEQVSGTPLRERLVAAYPIGFVFYETDLATSLPDIPVCDGPEETACYATWNSFGPNATPYKTFQNGVCVNPLNWRKNGAAVPSSDNPGTLSLSHAEPIFAEGITGAECKTDRLEVGPFTQDIFTNIPENMGKENYHILDIALFYGSLRENAAARVNAHLARE